MSLHERLIRQRALRYNAQRFLKVLGPKLFSSSASGLAYLYSQRHIPDLEFLVLVMTSTPDIQKRCRRNVEIILANTNPTLSETLDPFQYLEKLTQSSWLHLYRRDVADAVATVLQYPGYHRRIMISAHAYFRPKAITS